MKIENPSTLSANPSIVVVSVSGGVDIERLHGGVARLRELGFPVTIADGASASWRYFAGTDEQRLDGFAAALATDAQIVMFSRGGYGVSRLLHRIDWSRVAASGKIFCGFSDITAFSLAALAKANLSTWAGPMAAVDFAQTDNLPARHFTERHFVGLLSAAQTGHDRRYVYPECTSDIAHPPSTITGTLWGTNLAMIAHLIGTPYMPSVGDGILVLEDIGEEPYAIERMFWQLKHAGILDQQKAIILGDFADCEPAANLRYRYNMAEAIETLRQIAPCPVLTGFPFGHIPAKVTLPIGVSASLTIHDANYSLSTCP